MRITDADYIVEAPFAPQFIFDYDELRFCLAQGRAAGFRAEGKGYYIPWLLYREYPEEFASIARESVIGAEPDPNDPKRTYFQTVSSMKDLGLEPSVRSLGYGGSGSDFRLQDDRTYFAYYYPSHTEGERGCAVF